MRGGAINRHPSRHRDAGEQSLLCSLDVYETHRIDDAEAYPAACAERAGVRRIVSFDRSLDRAGSVDRIAP